MPALRAGRPKSQSLFTPQCNDGIDSRRAARGEKTSCQRDQTQEHLKTRRLFLEPIRRARVKTVSRAIRDFCSVVAAHSEGPALNARTAPNPRPHGSVP